MQHKSSTDTKRWIPLDSFTWKGHNQISARHARGGDFAVVHTFEAFLFIGEGGIRSRAIMGLATASTLMETHGHSSNRIASRIAYNVSWRNAWRVNFVNQSFSLTDLSFLIKFLIIWIWLFSFCDYIRELWGYLSEIIKKSQFVCIIRKLLGHQVMS